MTSPNPFAPPVGTTTPVAPSGEPSPAQPYAAEPYPVQPYGAPPYAAQPYPAQPYGAPPYAAQPNGHPFPPPGAYAGAPLPGMPYPMPAHLRTGLAQASLFTGLGALVVGLPLTVGVAAVGAGLVGLVLGVVALRRIGAGTAGGRAYAWWGIALSAVASVAGVLVFLAVVADDGPDGWYEDTAQQDAAAADDVWDEAYNEGYEDGFNGARLPLPAPGTEGSDVDVQDVPQLAFGERSAIGVYAVTVVDMSLDADDVVQPAFPGNVPPEGRYVMATISVTNNGTEPARPATDLYHYYPGDDDLMYGDWSCASWTPRPLMDVGPLAPGESAEYDVCFDVPTYAIGRPTLVVDDGTSTVYALTQWSVAPAG